MKKILYVSRAANDNLEFISNLKKLKPDLDITLGIYSEYAIYIEEDQSYIELMDSHKDIASFDLVFFKTIYKGQQMASAMANYLDHRDIKYIDGATKYAQITSKLYQYMLLANNGVHIPPSIFVHRDKIKQCFSLFEEKLKLPFILKDIHGLKGRDNYLIKSQEQFDQIISDNKDMNYIAQSYIENDGDYRVLIFGDKVYMVIHRMSNDKSSHINNTSVGGSYSQIEVKDMPEEVIEASVKAAKVLDRQVAGVDMVKDKNSGKWYCFEVNENPQLYTGALVEEKTQFLADFFEEATS